MQLKARWIVFVAPLTKVLPLPLEDKGHLLYGCILCVSAHGSIAVIALDGFQLYAPYRIILTVTNKSGSLYLVPGSSSPLQQVCVGENSLLVTYEDRRARLWDIRTKEFWRSMTVEKADEMMKQGDWITLYVALFLHFVFITEKYNRDLGAPTRTNESIWSTSPLSSSSDAAATLSADLDSVLFSATIEARAIGPTKAQIKRSQDSKELIKAILSATLWLGVSEDLSLILEEDLALPPSDAYFGLPLPFHSSKREEFVSMYPYRNVDIWKVSEESSAARMLVIVVVLRALALFSGQSD